MLESGGWWKYPAFAIGLALSLVIFIGAIALIAGHAENTETSRMETCVTNGGSWELSALGDEDRTEYECIVK